MPPPSRITPIEKREHSNLSKQRHSESKDPNDKSNINMFSQHSSDDSPGSALQKDSSFRSQSLSQLHKKKRSAQSGEGTIASDGSRSSSRHHDGLSSNRESSTFVTGVVDIKI